MEDYIERGFNFIIQHLTETYNSDGIVGVILNVLVLVVAFGIPAVIFMAAASYQNKK